MLPPSLYFKEGFIASNFMQSNSWAAKHFDIQIGDIDSNVRFSTNLMVIIPSSDIFKTMESDILPNLGGLDSITEYDVINTKLFNTKNVIERQLESFKLMTSILNQKF